MLAGSHGTCSVPRPRLGPFRGVCLVLRAARRGPLTEPAITPYQLILQDLFCHLGVVSSRELWADRAERCDHEVAVAHSKLYLGDPLAGLQSWGGGVPCGMRPSRGLYPEEEESRRIPGEEEVQAGSGVEVTLLRTMGSLQARGYEWQQWPRVFIRRGVYLI